MSIREPTEISASRWCINVRASHSGQDVCLHGEELECCCFCIQLTLACGTSFSYELHQRDPCLWHFSWNSGWGINTWTHAFVQDKDTKNEGRVNGRMKQRNRALIHLVSYFSLDTFSYEMIDFSYATFQFQKDAPFLADDSLIDTI